ncbi:LuxR C-terminal-related transcriptional regulator [Phytoactinopolyspora limicola]|uniref:LuxR C-terminal-related transcriptional regulator n=1 Tax=Phytoactinopolyspora limicola TaxID=2715536 RepID=UPI00140CBB5D|nr:LuxR C-terminal-related transcriptional regulator [Phytoactinopolyspora limicola]
MTTDGAGLKAQRRTVSLPSGLMSTKLFVPPSPAGFIPRSRLVSQLDDGVSRKLTLVCAPAGAGKTALLADWSRQHPGAVAWLSLDAGDNDPARFWRHAVAAIDRVRPGVAERFAPLFGPPPPSTFDGLVTAVINELTADPAPVLLLLDDYHLIDSEQVHASVRFLLENSPPGLHVALASRGEPPLSLARLRARGQLAEVGSTQLRFTDDETAALLQAAGGANLTADVVRALTSRTEGWAAGLQLAGLSLRSHPDPAEFVATFTGSHRYVFDYLTAEVLDLQTESLREFLLETSVLDRLSGPLCAAVTGRPDCQATLEAIDAANLFLVPLDEQRGWWRYHHLFAELLRARLMSSQPERARDLHRNAAVWYEERGLVGDAVGHRMAAGDTFKAARLIEQYFDELYLSSEKATVQRWLAALPADVRATRSRLHLTSAALSLIGGQVDEVADLLDLAERTCSSSSVEVFEPSVGRAASRLANIPAGIAVGRSYIAHLVGRADDAIRYGQQARAALDDEWMLDGLAQASMAAATWVSGQVAEAEQALVANIALWQATRQNELVAIESWLLGRVHTAQGRLDAAYKTYQHALTRCIVPGQPPPTTAGVAHVGMADVAYQRGNLGVALGHAIEGVELCRHFAFPEYLARGLVTLAWIRQAEGDPGAATAAIHEAQGYADPAVVDLFNPVPAQAARLLLAQGDLAGAAGWVADRGLGVDDEVTHASELTYLVLARVRLAQGEVDDAVRLLGRLHAAAAAQRRMGNVGEIQALRALALAAVGDDDAGITALADALKLAQPAGYLRVFVDEGRPMGELLGRLIAARRTGQAAAQELPLTYLGQLAKAFDAQAPDRAPHPTAPTTSNVITGLSDREFEVLQLLATGRRNDEIAAELFVTLSTVKKHVTHILEKLGAANRTEATVRARAIGLIS